ncbi:MAG: pitrilysin family protein [Peptococcia bacterium]
MQKNDIEKIVLDNGVRIVTEKVPGVRSVAMGIWVGAGSRYENEDNAGITHFIEHLMFKGTEKRTATEIAEALDSVGGQLNAFTTKELTCYYAKTLDEHFPVALDVLSDMFFNSRFDPQAIEKERGVVEEEIKMYEDTPDDLIHDLFVQTVWPNHPLGKPILGTIESLEGIDRDKIMDYISNNYLPERIVISIAGNIEHKAIQEQVGQVFSKLKNDRKPKKLQPPVEDEAHISNLKKDTGQVQICLGTVGLSQHDERIYTVNVLNSVLGGGLSSRLVQAIREERGLAYTVFCYHTAFSDTGLFTFYAGTSPQKYDEVITLLLKEIDKVVKDGITEKELNKAKEQIKGGLFLGLENVSSRMTRTGRNLLCLDRIISPEEVVEKVSKITLQDVHVIAKELFENRELSLSTIGPLDKAVDLAKYKGKL